LLDGYYIDVVDDPVLMKKAKRDKEEGNNEKQTFDVFSDSNTTTIN